MAKVSTNINIDEDLKKSCQELFGDLGMDLTTAVNIFLRQCIKVQGLPFDVTRSSTKKVLGDYDSFQSGNNSLPPLSENIKKII